MIVREMLVCGQCGVERRLVPNLGQLHAIVPHLDGALPEGHRRVDAGGRRLLPRVPGVHEVHRGNPGELGQPLLHLAVVLHHVVRRRCLDGAVVHGGLRVRHLNLFLGPERPLDLLHFANAGRPRLVGLAVGQLLRRTAHAPSCRFLLVGMGVRGSYPAHAWRLARYRDPVARAAQGLDQLHRARVAQVLLDGLPERARQRIVVGRVVHAGDRLRAHQMVQLAR
mmetsp:Transcript_40810/g.107853  ORF Transcript_40810/g.107853 Transcript_40810/m.107853 type:complete len:224 (+) Transcript_40810:187-858(+)